MAGTGTKLTEATIAIAGVASIVATILSIVSIWFQLKNYRKPLLQRYVVRILVMVPIYSIASWVSMVSLTAASWVAPIRDIYEAFTIYTFFQLLINYIGGERALIIMTHGRRPVHHLWPMNHVLPPIDISDPHAFLGIKRGILQYAWLKPVLALTAIIMKATGVYQEGYIGVTSGYFWSGIVYNISVTVSLYSLALFWVCMHDDLLPFRPVPKFLCIKLIIFASYWQGFFLSILVWLGAIPDDVRGYTPDNLAAAIQDALICVEMPAFAVAHWYAFSWHDYADNQVSAARLPVTYAMRDAFGPRDLIEDSKETFSGNKYAYRVFDSAGKVIAHEDSKSRLARINDGMRYERGGKAKYWLPKPGDLNATTDIRRPLLGSNGGPSRQNSDPHHVGSGTFDEVILDPDEENLYDKARQLEFGDWNYPVITANEPDPERWSSTRHYYHTIPADEAQNPPADDGGLESHNPGEAVQVISKKKGKRKQQRPSRASTSAQAPQERKASPKPAASSSADDDDDAAESPALKNDVGDEFVSPGIEESGNWGRSIEHGVMPPAKYDAEENNENPWGGS